MNHTLISFTLIIALLGLNNTLKAQSKISKQLQSQIISEKTDTHTVWIFFTDKGDNIKGKLEQVKQDLPPNAKKRRIKSMKGNPIVNFNDIPINKNYLETLQISPNNLRHTSAWLNAISAQLDKEKIEQIAQFAFVKKIDLVRKATKKTLKNSHNSAKSLPNIIQGKNNYDYGNSFTQMQQINVPAAHNLGFTGNGVIVCILDGGYNNLEHPVFSSLDIIATYDFVNDDDNVDDEDDMGVGDHGTKTLSSIGGFQEQHLVSPAFGASYILAKTENTEEETQIEEDNWVAAMEWAEENYGPDVSTSSLGYPDWYETSDLDGNTAIITIAADYAASIGILVLNSAGNDGGGTTTISAPADGDSVLTVGAVDSRGDRTYFSSVGPTADGRIKPDIMAMGEEVIVADVIGSNYTTADGTSFSCPIAAGAATLLLEMCPEATNMDIFEALRETASKTNEPDNYYGKGIIDVMAAYNYLIPQIEHDTIPDSEQTSQAYTVEAFVTSYYELVENSPTLHFKFENNNWQTITMQNISENNYSADIPANGENGTFHYYISVQNIHRTVLLPQNAPTEFYSFTIGPDQTSPLITHNPLKEYYINLWGDAKVICSITDNINVDVQSCKVEWKINDNQQANIPLSEQDDHVFVAEFSKANIQKGDLIKYRIIAGDLAQTPNLSTLPEEGYNQFYITDIIDFEQNSFSHNWEFNHDAPWQIIGNGAENSDYSAKSGAILNEEESSISIHIETEEDGEVSFYKKVSSEENFDFFQFFIDETQQNEWSGEIDWSVESYALPAGEHTLLWKYVKDWVNGVGEDCAQIDMISLPMVVGSIGIETTALENSFTISPNPVRDMLHIILNKPEAHCTVKIYNLKGELIRTENTLQINVKNLQNGLYFIQVESTTGIYTDKFIKQ